MNNACQVETIIQEKDFIGHQIPKIGEDQSSEITQSKMHCLGYSCPDKILIS